MVQSLSGWEGHHSFLTHESLANICRRGCFEQYILRTDIHTSVYVWIEEQKHVHIMITIVANFGSLLSSSSSTLILMTFNPNYCDVTLDFKGRLTNIARWVQKMTWQDQTVQVHKLILMYIYIHSVCLCPIVFRSNVERSAYRDAFSPWCVDSRTNTQSA